MKNEFEFTGPSEFDDKTANELYEEFMGSLPVSEDSYVNFYGAYFMKVTEILPTSRLVFLWMAFNSELDKGRVTIQSLTQKRLLKDCKISQVAYFKSLRDLKEHNVIRGCRAVYHINPRFAWKGTHRRRLQFMEQYPYIQNERMSKKDL